MNSIHILFGFDKPEFEQAVKELLKSKGYIAEIHSRFSKLTIKEYLENNPTCNTVVLTEVFNKKMSYTAEELAQLTDMRDINVIIVLAGGKRGSDYMKTLYMANITNAILQKGRNGGATPADVAALILQRRSRKDAREYYGISSKKMELGFLENETYLELYRDFKKMEGEYDSRQLLKNYISVCSRISPMQIWDFTRRLPADDRNVLIQFEEFHQVAQLLKKFGFDLKIKKPKNVSIGMETLVGISVQNDKIHFDSGKEEIKTDKQEDVAAEAEEVSEESLDNMSLAALFGGFEEDNEVKVSDKAETQVSDIIEKKEQGKEEKPDESVVLGDLSSLFSNMGSSDDMDDEDDMDDDMVKPLSEEKETDNSVKQSMNFQKEKDIQSNIGTNKEKGTKKVTTSAIKADKYIEDDDEEYVEKISFGDLENVYDDISLDSGAGNFVKAPFIVAVLVLLVLIVAVYVYGGTNIVKLF